MNYKKSTRISVFEYGGHEVFSKKNIYCVQSMASMIKGKACPKDFKKPELVNLTSAKLGVPAKTIQRLNKDSLCQTYIRGVITNEDQIAPEPFDRLYGGSDYLPQNIGY